MSDTVKSWIEERRRIHELGNDVLLRNSYELERETDLGIRDAKAVEDGFNNLPALLTAVEKVLEVLDGWEPPDPCNLEIDPCLDCLMINEMRRAIEGAIK